MKHKCCAAALAVLLLVGCAVREAEKPGTQPAESAVPEESGRDSRVYLGSVGSAVLHEEPGWSVYIPSEGWTLELESAGDIPHTTWTADGEEDVSLSVYAYEDMSFMVARDRFTSSCGYTFEEGTGGRLGEPVWGSNGCGNTCAMMVAEGLEGVTYVIAWTYPEDSNWQDPTGIIAGTFELTE